ncbi:MAG: helix-turn-helix domain-containing protein [Burkholderiales bacterium]|nr:helix-turn-helix domain-containing protein [Burkholderiales bacterium]
MDTTATSTKVFIVDDSIVIRERLGYSGAESHLRMAREEIGSYLGLKLETVSRAFSKFQEYGLFEVHNKHIRELDTEGLAATLEEDGMQRLCQRTTKVAHSLRLNQSAWSPGVLRCLNKARPSRAGLASLMLLIHKAMQPCA